jgi:kynureninase
MCGNSLGLQPKDVRDYIEQELNDWEALGVEGHFQAKNPWMPYHEFLTEPIARIVGAKALEVVTMNSLTVNLHLLMVSFYRPTDKRHKILIETNAFPSDQYAAQSQIKYHGYDPEEALLELPLRDGEVTHRPEDIEAFIKQEGDSIALTLLGGINYYTGQAFDMQRITETAKEKGSVVGFDLAHAAGNLELHLHDWDVDFAAWCSYKYLNSGPGGIAGVFVHERHTQNDALPRFAGWWGHDKESRFLMESDYVPIRSAEGWQMSNPPILSLAALRASLHIFDKAGISALREKSCLLTGYMEFLIDRKVSKGVAIITPRDPQQRGCQLSLVLKKNGREVYKQLAKNGFICDWREPDVIRVAPVPLYNTFQDVLRFVEFLEELN